MNIDISYYLSIFWRRFPHFTLVAMFFSAVGVTTAFVLPPEYEATATLVVESPQIPDALAASTVQTVVQEQLQIIEQRLVTRGNLIDTATRLDVFGDREEMTSSDVVEEMRERTTFNASTGRNSATFLRVTFRGEDPVLSAKVANEFVTLILDENVRIRTALAGGTLEFFEEEVDRLTAEIDRQSAEILKFKSENADALPENRDFLVERQAALTDASRTAMKDIEDLEQQKRNTIELFEATGAINATTQSPEELAFRNAQRELEEALLVFAPSHPRVGMLEARVANLENQYRESLALGTPGNPVVDGPRAVLNAQLSDLDDRIQTLREQQQNIESEIEVVDQFLSQVPANTVVIDNLQRDLDNTQAQYQEAAARLSAAATGARIELLSKGQRISVLEQATVPEAPTKPNRLLIALAGVGAGVSFGLGLVLFLELLNRSIRRPVEISDKLGITPFAVLPFVRTEGETRLRRVMIVMMLLTIVIGIPLIMWGVHSFVVPLDSILERILNRFGMTISG